MRNLKKILALVLALMMTLSLMVTASAVKFDDAKDSKYDTAIQVMSEIGVINGTEKGFNPNGTLKRSEAAKIIAYMLLGEETANTLSNSSTVFTDVPASHWASGAIAYCTNMGIVGGVGNGKFAPDSKLTGQQFGKMLLVAIGAGEASRYSGSGWEVNVTVDAKKLGLLSGLNVVMSNEITREQACQMAFNALYWTDSGNVTGKFVVRDLDKGNSTAKTMDGEIFDSRSDAILTMNALDSTCKLGTHYEIKAHTDNTGSVADTVFGLVDPVGDYDAFGRPITVYAYNDSTECVVTADEAAQTYTTATSGAAIVKALGNRNVSSVTYKIDNKTQAADDKDKLSKVASIGGNGTLTQVYYEAGAVTVTVINTYKGNIATRTAATSTAKENVTINVDGTKNPAGVAYTPAAFNTTAFSDTDVANATVVLYTAAWDATSSAYVLQSVDAAKSVTAIPTRAITYSGNPTYFIAGETYYYSDNYLTAMAQADVDAKTAKVIYLDNYGYAIEVTGAGNDTTTNYAVLLDYGKESTIMVGDGGTTYYAKLLYMDGTSETVKYLVDGTTHKELTSTNVGKLYTYTPGANGLTVLTAATVANKTNENITRNKAELVADGSIKANEKTYFVVKGSNNTYTIYNGIYNVPSMTKADYDAAVPTNAKFADVVVVSAWAGSGSASKDVVYLVNGSEKKVEDVELKTFYTYNAVVNGEITTVDTNAQIGADKLYSAVARTDKELLDISACTAMGALTNGNGMVSSTGIIAASNGVVRLGKTADQTAQGYTYTSSTLVFIINADNSISASSVNAIATDANDEVTAVIADNQLSVLFITKK